MKKTGIYCKYLIIGNSAGGIGAAEAIREIDKEGPLTIVSDEPYPAYSRPLISEYLSGERDLDRMLFRPSDFYERNNVRLLSGRKVQNIDFKNKTASIDDGETLHWEKLLLAMGGIPIIPKMKGMEREGVFSFLTLDDARRIAGVLDNTERAVVIGGGLIGISVTEALVKRSIKVTVIEMKDRILNTILDETASAIAEGKLRKLGVAIVANHTVTEIIGDSAVEGVVLDSGEKILCDVVIVAIGVLPRIELVRNSEIKVNRGIVVDQYMTTSHPDVYSCGDVAEAYDFVIKANRVIPIWPNAYIGGRTAGYNMAGFKHIYPGGTVMNSLNYFGLDIAAAGIVTSLPDSGCQVVSSNKNGIYKKIVIVDNRITGFIFMQDIEKAGIFFGLIKDGVDVGNFKQDLLNETFGLVYLPAELRKERLSKDSVKLPPKISTPKSS
jgi:NAD(P)H-nitrite reductase large subunit